MRYAIEDDIRQNVELVTAEDIYDVGVPSGAKVYAETTPGNWERIYVAEVRHDSHK